MLTRIKSCLHNAVVAIGRFKASPAAAQQGVHFSAGYIAIITTRILHGNMSIAVACAVIIPFWIEYVFDQQVEHDPFWPKGAMDFGFYELGAAIGLLIARLVK